MQSNCIGPSAFGLQDDKDVEFFVQEDNIVAPGAKLNCRMALQDRRYYTYMMSNRSKTIYTGITNGLRKRVFQHKMGLNEGFTHKYKVDRLVYYEAYGNVLDAIAREKEIKGWLRIKKIQLIVSINPTWADLSCKLFPDLEEEVQKELAREKKDGAE